MDWQEKFEWIADQVRNGTLGSSGAKLYVGERHDEIIWRCGTDYAPGYIRIIATNETGDVIHFDGVVSEAFLLGEQP